jgi:hypothetical protein
MWSCHGRERIEAEDERIDPLFFIFSEGVDLLGIKRNQLHYAAEGNGQSLRDLVGAGQILLQEIKRLGRGAHSSSTPVSSAMRSIGFGS